MQFRSFIMALAVTMLMPFAQATEVIPMLTSEPPVNLKSLQASRPHVEKQRDVSVNLKLLGAGGAKIPDQIGLELFDGDVITISAEKVEKRNSNNYTWHGKVAGGGQAILTVVNGAVAGTIVLTDAKTKTPDTYQLQTMANGAQVLRKLKSSGFPSDHPPGQAMRPPGKDLSLSAPKAKVTAADTGELIGVLIVYSDKTAAAAGTAIGAQAQQAIDTANAAYANSGITTRLQLVGVEHVAYVESGDFNTDLSRLTSTTDGYMDNVHTLRNTYKADLVSLFIENGQYCGLAWIGPYASYGFSVVNRGCASGNLSFAHELGHNMGALHDPYVDPSSSPYPYGHGYAVPAQRWRTVMAYNNVCAAAGTSCTRIPYFSNPNVLYGGLPTGTSDVSDNARVINQNATTIANFRAEAVVCTYSLQPSSVSFPSTGGSAVVTVTTQAGCAWNASSSTSWLAITSATAGTGAGQVNYSVAANPDPSVRTANMTIGGQTFMVTEAAYVAPPPPVVSPVATLVPTTIDFGQQKLNTTSGPKVATFTNTGGGQLMIKSLSQSGSNFARSGTCAAGVVLAAQQSCTFQYVFKPSGLYSRSATLTIRTNVGSPKLKLTGYGIR